MGIFSIFKKRHHNPLKDLTAFAGVFTSLDKLEAAGMVSWDTQQRRLFIEQPLAFLMIQKSASWQNFIQNCYLWQYYREVQSVWDAFILKEELAAVRQAKSEADGKELSRADIERIRYARRQSVLQSELQPPKVEGFEFFVVKSDAVTTNPDASYNPDDASSLLIAVGHYDPDTENMEMALWSDIKPLLDGQ